MQTRDITKQVIKTMTAFANEIFTSRYENITEKQIYFQRKTGPTDGYCYQLIFLYSHGCYVTCSRKG